MTTTNNTTRNPNYWAFRVDRNNLETLDGELEQERLRQGWGYDDRQNLNDMSVDGGARRNMRMLQVRKGDRILIPHLPGPGQVTIAEATQDWKEGYRFSILEGLDDFGHIFPARRLKSFKRSNENVPASLRSTFRNPCRFWKIDHCSSDIEHVLSFSEVDLEASSRVVERWQELIERIVQEKNLRATLLETAKRFTTKAEWEWLLADALDRLNPGWSVKRTGGKKEADHGTDILVTIPDIFGSGRYGIAIQVKDYSGEVREHPVLQISKAPSFWNQQEIKILEMVVVLIGGKAKDNPFLTDFADKQDPPVRLVWATDVEDLVYRSACQFISDPSLSKSTQGSPETTVDVEDL